MRPTRLLSILVFAILATGALASDPPMAPAAPSTPMPPPDRWAAFRPLLGSWEGTSSGQPGQGTVRREFRLVLNDRYLEVRNTSTYPATEKKPQGEVHEDFGVVSYDKARKVYVFRQFHVEGFVNTYVSENVAPERIVFVTEAIENIPKGFRARETWNLQEGALHEVFELAEPAADFAPYSETRLKRTP